jgi:ATP-dependent DNA helicase 2 subunit 2
LPWYDPSLSFNPAVHRIKQALFHAAIVPNLVDHPPPHPHPDLTRYFEPPPKLLKRAFQSLDGCKRAFNVSAVPKKVAKRKVEMHVAAVDEDDLILAPRKKPRLTSPTAQEQTDDLLTFEQNTKNSGVSVEEKELSETEPESDDNPPARTQISRSDLARDLPPHKDVDPSLETDRMDVDRGIPEGRIIGTTYPLDDFIRNLSNGDVVTKAVEDLGLTIQEIALQPFAERRHDELLKCLHEMRKVCMSEDEIDLWNE